MSTKEWMPELVYQDDSPIPLVEVPVDQDMPNKLFVWAYKHTGEMEPGPEGEELPVCDMDIHMYLDYGVAKEVLSVELLDELRTAFGLEPLAEAAEKGQQITDNVMGKVAENRRDVTQEETGEQD